MARGEPGRGRLSADGARLIRDRLINEAGSYLRNVVREPGVTCGICACPVRGQYELCRRCQIDQQPGVAGLSRLVVPIFYAVRGAQSGHLMWMYKDRRSPAGRGRALLTMTLLAALHFHEQCMIARLGREFSAWSVVPSTRQQTGVHPLRAVVRGARPHGRELELSANPWSEADDRATASDRFVVVKPADAVGAHLLLVEDTWATGAHAQSAASALIGAGAASVTLLVLGRWLNPDTDTVTVDFIRERLTRDYDPLVCPLGSGCSAT